MNTMTPKKKPKGVVLIEEQQILWNMMVKEMRAMLRDVQQFNGELHRTIEVLRQHRANIISFPMEPR